MYDLIFLGFSLVMREALSNMKVLDAGDENLVKDIGKSLQKGNKSFSTRPCDFTFFPPRVSFAMKFVQKMES